MSSRTQRTVGLVLAATLLAGTTGVAQSLGGAGAAEAATSMRLTKAIKTLAVTSETNAGYDRSAFSHWVDADGDGQDTRAEVLIAESQTRTTISGGTVRTGTWRSYYDGQTWRNASDVDIDHLVPLKEAWGSGAKRWNADTRKRFANDLGDRRSLVAVTDNVNQSKSDRDPAQWLPREKAQCRYVQEWVAVKKRWELAVDRPEKRVLTRLARDCGSPRITIKAARVVRGSNGAGGGGGTVSGGAVAPISTWNCPATAPIKGNLPSRIYHPPSSPWYKSTTPEECFATESAARKAGYRRAIY